MRSRPDIRVRSAYALPFDLLKREGIKAILFDMDNTLASFYETFDDVSDRALALKEECLKEGFLLAIASNGQGHRVKAFAQGLKVPFFPMMMKPFSFRLRKLLREQGWKKEEVCLVGDQLMTDCKAAKGAGIFFCLSDPLVKKEPFFTRINRFFEKSKRKKINALPYDTLLNREELRNGN